MYKLTKLLVLSSIASATLFANDNLVINFEKKRVAQNPNIQVKDIKVFYKKELEIKGWQGYILDLDATIQYLIISPLIDCENEKVAVFIYSFIANDKADNKIRITKNIIQKAKNKHTVLKTFSVP